MENFVRKGPYRGPVRAVIFDWAGTMVDYGCMAPVEVFMDVFKNKKVNITAAEARGPMGLMKRDHIAALCTVKEIAMRWEQEHGALPTEKDIDEMYRVFQPMMVDAMMRYTDPVPGAVELASRLRKRNIRIGSSTGYTAEMMNRLVPAVREKGYSPDAVVASTDVPKGRPFPWMCYVNALKLEVYPMESFVKVGDTVSDIHEGLNAGMWTVGVVKGSSELGMSLEEVRTSGVDELLGKIEDVKRLFLDEGAHYVIEEIGQLDGIIDEINARLSLGDDPLIRLN